MPVALDVNWWMHGRFSIYVRDVETVKDMPDVVNWCKFGSMAWEEHGRGFFYSAFARQQKLEVRRSGVGPL